MQLFTQHMVHPTYGPFTKPDYINPPMKTTINSDYVSLGAYLISPYDSWPIPWPGSAPRRQRLPAVRSGGRTARILVFSSHFAQKSSNFLEIQLTVHTLL